jgi:hypothetical protein
MEGEYDKLLSDLERLETEAKRLRSVLQSPTTEDRKPRDEALVDAVRLWTWSTQGMTGPVSVAPGAGSGSSSSAKKVTTTCPHCQKSLTITLT